MHLFLLVLVIMLDPTSSSSEPGPGDVFREYSWNGPWVNAGNWQPVTDPDASHSGAAQFLPNPANTAQLDDLVGQRVAILASGVHEAGTHAARWNAHDDAAQRLASGVYLGRMLSAGGRQETRKLVLVR